MTLTPEATMTEPLVYHVQPEAPGRWLVLRESHPEPLADFPDRDSALAFARRESGKIGLAEIVIHAADGALERVEPHPVSD
jgi:hypothetical protein